MFFSSLDSALSLGFQGGGRSRHDQASMLELKRMLSELRELLYQQVAYSVASSCVLLWAIDIYIDIILIVHLKKKEDVPDVLSSDSLIP